MEQFYQAILHLIAFCFKITYQEALSALQTLDFNSKNIINFYEDLDADDLKSVLPKAKKSSFRLFYSALRLIDFKTPICSITDLNSEHKFCFPLELSSKIDSETGGNLKSISLRNTGELCLITHQLVPEAPSAEYQYIWTTNSFEEFVTLPTNTKIGFKTYDTVSDKTQRIPLLEKDLLNPQNDLIFAFSKASNKSILDFQPNATLLEKLKNIQIISNVSSVLLFLSYLKHSERMNFSTAMLSLYQPPTEWFLGKALDSLLSKVKAFHSKSFGKKQNVANTNSSSKEESTGPSLARTYQVALPKAFKDKLFNSMLSKLGDSNKRLLILGSVSNKRIVATLPIKNNLYDQYLSDIMTLEGIGRLDDGTLPIREYILSACDLCSWSRQFLNLRAEFLNLTIEEPSYFTHLRKSILRHYNSSEDLRVFALDSGIPIVSINFNTSPENIASSIVQQARRQYLIPNLKLTAKNDGNLF